MTIPPLPGIQVGKRAIQVVDPKTREPLPVRRWNDGQLPRCPEFRAGDGYNKRRTQTIDKCCWHWTGGEGEPDRMAETLRKRKLGVEFAIGRSGRIWQFCDPLEVDTADAGILNARSVGVEIVCYGYAASIWDPLRAIKVPLVPLLGKDRETYEALTHGRRVVTAKFYPAQLRAALALADALSAALGIARAVPEPGYDTGVYPGVREFGGHVGHYQITDSKRDPGPWFMRELREHFAANAQGGSA